MIFYYHFLTFIGASLGILLSASLSKTQFFNKRYIMLFFLFLAIGLAIHALIFDATVNDRAKYIKWYVNLTKRDETFAEKLNAILSNIIERSE